MDGPRRHHDKWNKSKWNLKNKINKQGRNWLLDTENKLMVTRGNGDGGLGTKGEEIRK